MGWAAPLLVTAQPSSVSAGWASGVGHVSRGLLELIGHVLAQFRPALNSGFFGVARVSCATCLPRSRASCPVSLTCSVTGTCSLSQRATSASC